MRITLRHLFLLSAILFVLIPLLAHAAEGAGGFVPLADFSSSQRLNNLYQEGDLTNFFNKLFLAAMSLGAILAVLRLSWAGYLYMGSDMWSDKGKAREVFRETLLGLFLLLGIWIILNQINPDILKLKIGTTQIGGTPTQTDQSRGNIFIQPVGSN